MTFRDNFAVTRSTEAWGRRGNGKSEAFAAAELVVTDRGLAVFEALTNGIPNPRFSGAVAGSPGTLPTGTGLFNPVTGLTRTIVTATDDDGAPIIGYRHAGTPSATNAILIQLSVPGGIAAVSGETWTFAAEVWVEVHSGAVPTAMQTHLQGYASNGSTATEAATGTVDRSVRAIYTLQRTLTGGTTAFLQPQVRAGVASGVATDFTVWIKAPSQIKKNFPYRAPIFPATTGAFTRGADVVTTLAGAGPAPFPGWTEGGLEEGFTFAGSVLFDDINLGVERTHWEISDGTTDEAARLYTAADGTLNLEVRHGAAVVALATCPTPISYAGRQVWAGSISAAGLILLQNIGILETATDGAFTMPAGLDQAARIGSSVSGAYLNAVVEQVYFGALQDAAALTNWVLRN